MYAVVLMMAMATGSDSVAWHRGGGCHGCYGCYGYAGCYGGYGCYGRHGCFGCYGGGFRHHARHGCWGCYGGYSCFGCFGGYGCWGPMVAYSGRVALEEPGGMSVAAAVPATIIVDLPADASLTFDGAPTTSTSAQRVFSSPNLPAGETFFYTLKGEIIRNGEKIVAEKRIAVRAGEETRIKMEFPLKVARR